MTGANLSRSIELTTFQNPIMEPLKKRLFHGDMTFYSIVGKLFNELNTVSYILTEVFSLEGRTVSRKVLKSESLLMLLWDNLRNKKIKAVFFLQVVTALKILDANEKWSFEENRNCLD